MVSQTDLQPEFSTPLETAADHLRDTRRPVEIPLTRPRESGNDVQIGTSPQLAQAKDDGKTIKTRLFGLGQEKRSQDYAPLDDYDKRRTNSDRRWGLVQGFDACISTKQNYSTVTWLKDGKME